MAVVGSEEIYPKFTASRTLARLQPLFMPPLPSRWRIEFCPPVDLSSHPPEAAEDRALILDVSAQVRETIQRAIRENLVERGGAFV